LARKLAGQPLELEQVTSNASAKTNSSKTWPAPSRKPKPWCRLVAARACKAIAERFPTKPVYAGLNTNFLGILEEQSRLDGEVHGLWRLHACRLRGNLPYHPCAKHMLQRPVRRIHHREV